MPEGTDNIVWLVSYPKSGNTWFRIILSNFLSESKEPININKMNATLIASSRSLFDTYVGTNSSDLTNSEIRNLRPELYRRISSESESLVFIKVHDAWALNEKGDPLFPSDITRGVIYIIRHPLDIAVSYAYHSNITYLRSLEGMSNINHGLCRNKMKLCNQLSQNLLTWSEHIESWLDRSGLPIYIIKYEDLHENAYGVFTKALDFLRISYTPSEINTAIRNSTFELVSMQEKSMGFREKPITQELFFRSGKIGSWKEKYKLSEIKSFVSLHGEVMQRFGYTLED